MNDAWPLALAAAVALVIGVAWRARRAPAASDPSERPARRPRLPIDSSDDPILTSMGLGRGDPPTERPATGDRR